MERIANDNNPFIRRWIVASTTAPIALILFLRGLFTNLDQGLPEAEALLYVVIFSLVTRWAITGCLASRPSLSDVPHAADWATLLLSMLFVAGITTSGGTALLCLLGILATMAIPLIHQLVGSLTARLPASEPSSVSQSARSGVVPAQPSNPTTPTVPVLDATPPVNQHEEEIDSPGATESLPKEHTELGGHYPGEGIQQTITRRMVGPESFLEGSLSFEMPPGESVHSLHIPIWPALPATPIVECDIEGFDGRVRVALSAPHGLRLEVRATEVSSVPRTGLVCFQAFASNIPMAA